MTVYKQIQTAEHCFKIRCMIYLFPGSPYFGQIHLPLNDGLSVKWIIFKNFFVFYENLIKLGDVLVLIQTQIQNQKRVAYFYPFKITNLGANSSNSTVLLKDQLKTP